MRISERGAAMVETAIVVPLLVLLVFGIVEFSRAWNTQNTLTQAAREGVREYALTQDAGRGETAARNAAGNLDPAALSVSMTACNPKSPTEVTVSFPFSYDIPFFGAATKTMTGRAVMRCGG